MFKIVMSAIVIAFSPIVIADEDVYRWGDLAFIDKPKIVEKALQELQAKHPDLNNDKLLVIGFDISVDYPSNHPYFTVYVVDTVITFFGDERIRHNTYYNIRIPADSEEQELEIGSYEGVPYAELETERESDDETH